jgi:hypothetical protein
LSGSAVDQTDAQEPDIYEEDADAEFGPLSAELDADRDPGLPDEVDGHGGGELGALAEFDDELLDGHVDGDDEVEGGELDGELEGDCGGDVEKLGELLGECDGDRDPLLDGDGDRLGCLRC